MKKSLLLILSLFAFSFLVAGCNTVRGVGQDLEAGGKGLAKASERVKDGKGQPKKKKTNQSNY